MDNNSRHSALRVVAFVVVLGMSIWSASVAGVYLPAELAAFLVFAFSAVLWATGLRIGFVPMAIRANGTAETRYGYSAQRHPAGVRRLMPTYCVALVAVNLVWCYLAVQYRSVLFAPELEPVSLAVWNTISNISPAVENSATLLEELGRSDKLRDYVFIVGPIWSLSFIAMAVVFSQGYDENLARYRRDTYGGPVGRSGLQLKRLQFSGSYVLISCVISLVFMMKTQVSGMSYFVPVDGYSKSSPAVSWGFIAGTPVIFTIALMALLPFVELLVAARRDAMLATQPD